MLALLSQRERGTLFRGLAQGSLSTFRKIGLRDVFASASTGKNLPDLHVRPPAAAGRSDLAGVELAGDGIEAGMTGRLYFSIER